MMMGSLDLNPEERSSHILGRVVLVCACHNRVEKTMRFLESLFRDVPDCVSLHVILLDDGSSDGTSERVKAGWPEVEILRGSGDLYWNGAMCCLEDAAMRLSATTVIFANDDVVLARGAHQTLASSFEALNRDVMTVLVGTFNDEAGVPVYGGLVRTKGPGRPLSLRLVDGLSPLNACDTFNANWVMIPAGAIRMTGGLDRRFRHGFADIDFGYRLAKSGVRLMSTGDAVGWCEANSVLHSKGLVGRSLRERLSVVFGPLRSPKDYALFVFKHCSPLLAPALVGRDVVRRLWLVVAH